MLRLAAVVLLTLCAARAEAGTKARRHREPPASTRPASPAPELEALPRPAPVPQDPPPAPKGRVIRLEQVEIGPGVPAALASALQPDLESALSNLDGASVIARGQAGDVLAVNRSLQLLGGQGASLGTLQADDVVRASLRPGGAGFELDLVRADPRTGSSRGASRSIAAPDAEALQGAAREAVGELFADLRPEAPAPRPEAAAQKPAGPRPVRIAVMEVRTAGDVPARAFAALNQSIAPELRKLEGVSAISSTEIADLLSAERQRQLLGCGGGESCLAELAGALDADELLTIDLTLVGSTYALTARRTDLRASKVLQTQLKQFPRRDGEELLSVVGPTIAALYPDRPLKAGRARGVEAEVVHRLNPPPVPRWAFFASSGATAAAAIAGGAFAFLAYDARSQYLAMASRTGDPVRASDLAALEDRAHLQLGIGNALLLSAGGLLVATAVEGFFTDWHDDRAAFSAAVALSPEGAGGVLAVRF